MRCTSAIFACLLATIVWLPSAGVADERLAITHPPAWDQVVTVTPSEEGPLYTVKMKEGAVLDADLGEAELREKYPDLYARVQSASDDTEFDRSIPARSTYRSPSRAMPLAISTFPASN